MIKTEMHGSKSAVKPIPAAEEPDLRTDTEELLLLNGVLRLEVHYIYVH